MANHGSRMPLIGALEALRDVRGDSVVLTSMGAAREWPRLSRHSLDFHYVPSTMGGVVPLGLGLALARPDVRVIALCGDGSLLMNLGALVTVAAYRPTNLTIVVFDNAVYEVTGGQTTAAALAKVDLTALANAAGIQRVASFDDLSAWRAEAKAILNAPGPNVVVLRVEPMTGETHLQSPGAMPPRVEAFRQTLAGIAPNSPPNR